MGGHTFLISVFSLDMRHNKSSTITAPYFIMTLHSLATDWFWPWIIHNATPSITRIMGSIV